MEGQEDYASGYSGACGLFSRDGACPAGTGLCGSGNQRGGWRAGAYQDALEAVGALQYPGFFICQQDGSGRNGPGEADEWTKDSAWRRLRGLWPGSGPGNVFGGAGRLR